MNTTVIQAIILVALATGAAVLTYAVHPRAPALYLSQAPVARDEVNLQQIQERWQGDVVWLDARTQEVYEKGHIPGARLLNEQGFQEQLLELLDVLQTTDKAVIIYCGGEKCEASRTIREKLLPIVPIEDCYILRGGYPAWKAAQP
jgi:rhodanese-related sulfurtransferase